MDDKEKAFGRPLATRDMTQRFKTGGFTFPFGVYPEEEFAQGEGYDSRYLETEGCFYYEIMVSHERILPTFLALTNLLPDKVCLVVKIHSSDYYRDHDTYISEEILDKTEVLWWIQDWKDVALDDGFFGVGIFTEGSGLEVFLDDHKTIHVYHKDPDLMESTLEKLGIPFVMDMRFFWDEPHYHEPLPLDEEAGDDYLTAFEDLADLYDLYLDEEEEETDTDGTPLGITCWKVEIRGFIHGDKDKLGQGFYSTLYVNAESRKHVTELVDEYLAGREEQVDLYLQMARVPVELLTTEMARRNPEPEEPGVWHESDRVVFNWDHPGQ
ncbi:MAG: hypothetical protein HY751_12865 [Nitrospinae bacterium]|nr:hypothetical protein [Nitrospinota bacterium]